MSLAFEQNATKVPGYFLFDKEVSMRYNVENTGLVCLNDRRKKGPFKKKGHMLFIMKGIFGKWQKRKTL